MTCKKHPNSKYKTVIIHQGTKRPKTEYQCVQCKKIKILLIKSLEN